MSVSDPSTRAAVWDLFDQLAERPDAVTISVDMDRWGKRRISLDVHGRLVGNAASALLHSYRATNVQTREHITTGTVIWHAVAIPVSVFVSGDPQ